jgi:hypothetical protein
MENKAALAQMIKHLAFLVGMIWWWQVPTHSFFGSKEGEEKNIKNKILFNNKITTTDDDRCE